MVMLAYVIEIGQEAMYFYFDAKMYIFVAVILLNKEIHYYYPIA